MKTNYSRGNKSAMRDFAFNSEVIREISQESVNDSEMSLFKLIGGAVILSGLITMLFVFLIFASV